jgi:hypothetical protein
MSRSEVVAGRGVIELGIRNRIAQGLAGAQKDIDAFGQKIAGIGAMIAASAGALLAAPIAAASRMEETVSKFGVVFGDSAKDVESWADDTSKAMQTSRGEMLGMLANMQDLLVPMGVMPGRAVGMSKTLSALAVDLGSFNNVASADAFRDLMAAITGESEPMKKYGVIVNETATKQELLNMGMDPKFADDAAKAQARLNIIMRGTTAAQGDAIRTSDSFANQMKALWSAVTDASAAIGGTFLRDVAAMVQAAVAGVGAVVDFVKANQEVVRAMALVSASAVGVGASMVAVGAAMKVAAVGMGALAVASRVAATVAGVAWSGLSIVFTALTIKSRIANAVIRAGWIASMMAIKLAWTGLTGAISIAMQGLIAVATVTAIVSPWIAGAVTIAAAWFGLEATMAALAFGAAAAWTSSAGTVTAAWTAATGVLVPLAGVIAGAYTSAAAFVGGAWATLAGAFASSGAIGVAAAIASGVAWAAFAVITNAIAIKQAIDAAIVSAAWSIAAGIASAAWTGFGVVLATVTSPAAIAATAAAAMSGAWAVAAFVASTAWATAWGIIASPILPVVALVGAVTVAMGGIVAAAGYAAVAGANFGAAWKIVTDTFGQLVSVVNTTFDAITAALSSGDYASATQALWLGIQAGFWVGVEATMNAFSWLFSEAWAATKRFFSAFVKAIMNPFAAAREIGTAIGELIGGVSSFDVSARVTGSQAALKALRDQTAAVKARKDAEKEAQRIKEQSMTVDEKRAAQLAKINQLEKDGQLTAKEAAKARLQVDQEMPAAMPAQAAKEKRIQIQRDRAANKITQWEADNRMQLVDQEEQQGKQKMRDDLKIQLDAGEINPEQYRKQMAAIDGLNESYVDLVGNLEMEILALEKGEQAADRKRMADEGLNAQQIKDIETLKAKKKALEEMKAVQEAMADQRVAEIFGKAQQFELQGMAPDEIFKRVMDQLAKDQNAGIIDDNQADQGRARAQENLQNQLGQQGANPAEVFKQVMDQIQQAQAAGRLDPADAAMARARAQENLQAGMDNLRNEGQQLAEALRTPQEKLQAELAKIGQLQAAGAIDQNVAKRAEDKARADFAETQAKEVDETIEQEKALGPTGTFSGFALGSGAFGSNFSIEKQSLKKLEMIDKNGKEAVKHLKQRQIARAG